MLRPKAIAAGPRRQSTVTNALWPLLLALALAAAAAPGGAAAANPTPAATPLALPAPDAVAATATRDATATGSATAAATATATLPAGSTTTAAPSGAAPPAATPATATGTATASPTSTGTPAAAAGSTATPATPATPERQVRLVVKLKPTTLAGRLLTAGTSPEEAAKATSIEEVVPAAQIRRLTVPASQVDASLAALRARPDVQYAEVERPVRTHQAAAPTVVASDPRFAEQWSLPKINAPAAWALATATSAVTVAVVDTGIALGHPDLQSRLVAGADCTVSPCAGGALQGNDGHGHGTHVAGVIAAAANNGEGIAGIAYGAPVRLMPVKVLDDTGAGFDGDVAAGIRWAVDNGARVVNLSLGGPTSSSAINEQIDYAFGRGVLVVASGGNCGDPTTATYERGCGPAGVPDSQRVNWPDYPAAYAGTAAGAGKLIPVAATDSGDARASFSTQGSYLASAGVAAPGRLILSTYVDTSATPPTATYRYASGTSMAAPHVSGLAAFMWSANPSLSLASVRGAIRTTAADVNQATAPGADDAMGAGRIDAYAALVAAGTGAQSSGLAPSPTASATAMATPTATATATATATPAALPTATPPATGTAVATVAPPAAAPAAPPADQSSSAPADGGSTGGGPAGGGASAPAPQPGRIPVYARESTPPAAPAPLAYTASPPAPGQTAVEIRAGGATLVAVDVATVDPQTGRRRFRGWLRSDSGPIFGLNARGELEWISPDDAGDLAEIDWTKLHTVPDAALTAVPLGQPRPGWLLWDFRGSGRIYVVGDDGALHYIPDMRTFNAQFQWKNVLPVNDAQVSRLRQGEGLPPAA